MVISLWVKLIDIYKLTMLEKLGALTFSKPILLLTFDDIFLFFLKPVNLFLKHIHSVFLTIFHLTFLFFFSILVFFQVNGCVLVFFEQGNLVLAGLDQ